MVAALFYVLIITRGSKEQNLNLDGLMCFFNDPMDLSWCFNVETLDDLFRQNVTSSNTESDATGNHVTHGVGGNRLENSMSQCT